MQVKKKLFKHTDVCSNALLGTVSVVQLLHCSEELVEVFTLRLLMLALILQVRSARDSRRTLLKTRALSQITSVIMLVILQVWEPIYLDHLLRLPAQLWSSLSTA